MFRVVETLGVWKPVVVKLYYYITYIIILLWSSNRRHRGEIIAELIRRVVFGCCCPPKKKKKNSVRFRYVGRPDGDRPKWISPRVRFFFLIFFFASPFFVYSYYLYLFCLSVVVAVHFTYIMLNRQTLSWTYSACPDDASKR